jgi:hypothetical protein
VHPVLLPLSCDPISQLGVFDVVVTRSIAVPVGFAIVDKLAQTAFPGGVITVSYISYEPLSSTASASAGVLVTK